VDTWHRAGIYRPKDTHSQYGYERGETLKETGMHSRRAKKKLPLALDESGATAIVFALICAVLCGFVGLAVDFGHMVMVRAELQRAADSGALAGAAGLLPYTNPGSNSTPNWANGVTKAHTMISNAANKSDNLQFTTTEGTVDYGYWLFNPPTGYVQTLPQARPTTASYVPVPAVKVTLSRDVTLYLAPLVGVYSPTTVSATATAILPESYTTTGVPPIAVSWDTVYNMVGGTAVIDVLEQDVKPQSNKGTAGWFNLNGGNSVPSVRIDTDLVADPTGIATGSNVYLVPGTKASLMDCITAGQTVIVPVVQDVSQKVWSPISEWAAFQVDSVSANSMTGHFVTQWFDPNIRPTAYTNSTIGVVAGTPKLVSP
jgi:Flp pilus assembly protein TadG